MKTYAFKCQDCGNLIIAYKKNTSTRRKCSRCGSYHVVSINHNKTEKTTKGKKINKRIIKTIKSNFSKKSKKTILKTRKAKKRAVKIPTASKNLQKFPTVSIVVVNYNGKKFLKECFDSLLRLNYPKNRYEIITVDNCSQDDSISFVKKNYPKIRIIENNVNNYAKANNLGIKNSTAEYIAILNNDTKVDKNWLIELIKVISKDKRIGGVGSKVLLKNGRIDSAGIIEFPNFYWQQRGYNELDKGQYNKIEEVYALCGVSMLFRRECLNDVGFEDEDFNIYVEEVDLALRCRRKRWKLIYVPKSLLWHEHSGTIKINSDFFIFHTERNRLYFVAKHYPYELPNAISTTHLFYKDIKQTHPFLFKLLPDIFKKLLKEQGKEVLSKVLPEIYKRIREITDFEKYDFLREALEKEATEGTLKNEIENLRSEKENIKQEYEKAREEAERYKEELMGSQLNLREREFQIERLNLELNDTKLELNCTKEELYSRKAELALINTKSMDMNTKLIEANKKLEQNQRELQQIQQQLNNKNIEYENLHQENENLKFELTRKKREIYNFYHSRGYRYLLGPIDKAHRRLRNLGRVKRKKQ